MTTMTTSNLFRSLALVTVTVLSTGTLSAQTSSQPAAHPTQRNDPAANINPPANEAPEPRPWTTEQIVTCTVSQCWQLSGKNEDTFFDIVQELAAMSAQKRGLVLPESEAAGRQAGELIKARAKADHDQLLYAVVDEAVRKVGKPAPTAAGK